jgi:hypothetical protein
MGSQSLEAFGRGEHQLVVREGSAQTPQRRYAGQEIAEAEGSQDCNHRSYPPAVNVGGSG